MFQNKDVLKFVLSILPEIDTDDVPIAWVESAYADKLTSEAIIQSAFIPRITKLLSAVNYEFNKIGDNEKASQFARQVNDCYGDFFDLVKQEEYPALWVLLSAEEKHFMLQDEGVFWNPTHDAAMLDYFAELNKSYTTAEDVNSDMSALVDEFTKHEIFSNPAITGVQKDGIIFSSDDFLTNFVTEYAWYWATGLAHAENLTLNEYITITDNGEAEKTSQDKLLCIQWLKYMEGFVQFCENVDAL